MASSSRRFGNRGARSALPHSRPYDPAIEFDGHITSVLDEVPTDCIAVLGKQVDVGQEDGYSLTTETHTAAPSSTPPPRAIRGRSNSIVVPPAVRPEETQK